MNPVFCQCGDWLYKLTDEKCLGLNFVKLQHGVFEIIQQYTTRQRFMKKHKNTYREIPQATFETHLRLALGNIMAFGHPNHDQYMALNKMIDAHGFDNITLAVKEIKKGKPKTDEQ